MPRDKRKSKAPPSNAKAMCDILRFFETSSPTLNNKEQRTNWLEAQLLRHESYPYPGTRKDVGAYHNADSLYEAITYAVRDGKKDEFKSLKGQAAIDQFFSIGRDMLKDEYLLSVGYQTTDEAGNVQLEQRADEAEQHGLPATTLKVEPGPSVSKAPRSRLGNPLTSKGNKRKDDADLHNAPIPRVTRKNSRLLSSQPVQALGSEPKLHHPTPHPALMASPIQEEHEVIYEPVRPASSTRKRKYIQVESSPEFDGPIAALDPGSPLARIDGTSTPLEATIRRDLTRLRDTIVDVSTDLCPENERLRLKGWPSQALFDIYAHIFGCTEWRHVFEDVVEYSGVRSVHLLQAVIWTFLDVNIFQKPLPWPLLTVQSNLDELIGALPTSTARWKHELRTVASKISLEQLEETTFLNSVVSPKAGVQADDLKALMSEHLADDITPSPPETRQVLAERHLASLRRICEEALLLHGRMTAAECVYRMIKHKCGSSIRQGSSSEHGGRARKQRKEVVALTIALGLERKEAQEVEEDVVEAFVMVETAMVVSS